MSGAPFLRSAGDFERPPDARRAGPERMLALIDVVFLLLIFFMLSGTLEPPDPIPVTAPKSTGALPGLEDSRAPAVWLGPDGELALGPVRVGRSELTARLRERLASSASRRVELRADARVQAHLLLPLLAQLEAAGAAEIELVTQPRSDP